MCCAVSLIPRRAGSATRRRGLSLLLLFLVLPACGRRTPPPAPVRVSSIPSGGAYQAGIASWYGPGFHGRTTANGETYDMYAMTAAHQTLPFDTWVRVVNLDNNESTVVRINDRGPFIEGRVIDLSRNAAQDIRMVGPGTARVQLLIVEEPIREWPPARRNSDPELPARQVSPMLVESPVDEGPFQERPFQIQVGAFSSQANATRLKARLEGQFPDVAIYEASGPGRALFRVRLGSFGSLEGAVEFRELLLQEGVVEEALVMRVGS